jgi:hypothetical protein
MIRVNAYGLTGAGIYFVNSTLKVMVRMNSVTEKFNQISQELWARMA